MRRGVFQLRPQEGRVEEEYEMSKKRVEGALDRTGTSAKIEFPGHYEKPVAEEGAAPAEYIDIEHGAGTVGLKRVGKKFLHLKSRLKKHYETTKKAT